MSKRPLRTLSPTLKPRADRQVSRFSPVHVVIYYANLQRTKKAVIEDRSIKDEASLINFLST